MRLLTKRTRLYTEMVVENTIHHTDNIDWHLRFSQCEAPVALQVGGSDPDAVRTALEKVVAGGYAYDEVNLNCGCPSERVATVRAAAALILQRCDPHRTRHTHPAEELLRRSPHAGGCPCA